MVELLMRKVWKMMTGEQERVINVDFLAMSSCLCRTLDSDVCTIIGSSHAYMYVDVTVPTILK